MLLFCGLQPEETCASHLEAPAKTAMLNGVDSRSSARAAGVAFARAWAGHLGQVTNVRPTQHLSLTQPCRSPAGNLDLMMALSLRQRYACFGNICCYVNVALHMSSMASSIHNSYTKLNGSVQSEGGTGACCFIHCMYV